MDALLLYLLKAHVALALFAGAYYGLLRRLTFFTLNRFYLLFALLFAAVYPALPVPALLPAEPLPNLVLVAASGVPASELPVVEKAAVSWQETGLGLYAAGTVLLLLRLLVQLLSIQRVRRTSSRRMVEGQVVYTAEGLDNPFSFGQSIYLNPAQHSTAELAAVLRHEQVHVQQRHTLDVLLAQVVVAAAWCNPAAWLLRRALLDNLEYLADRAVLATGLDRRTYQFSLLRLSQAAGAPSLVSPFSFSTLKNRVIMMNTPFSSNGQLARYLVAGPLVLAVALGISAARAQAVAPAALAPATSADVRTVVSADAPRVQQSQPVAADTPSATAAAQSAEASKATKPRPKPRGGQPVPATSIRKTEATSADNVLAQAAAPKPLYFVDGKAFTADINTLNPQEIASLHVLKGEQARQSFGEAGAAGGVIIITTKANQHQSSVQAFNEKVGAVAAAPAAADKPEKVGYLAAPALAYIVKNYPAARLISVSEITATDGGAPRYEAMIVIGRRPGYLLFDGQGQFISESYTKAAR